MADGEGGGGGGSTEWLPIFDRVEARVEALAADRARLEAADRVQRESWEAARRLQRTVEEMQAAAREKDGEIYRLRAEAADARRKLQEVHQEDVRRRGRWEAAYLDLLLGANQKLAELRDGDLEDSGTCAQTPNTKEVGSCSRLSQNIVDHIGSDLSTELRKLKRAYETMSSKKDKQVSALLSEKDYVSNQLSIMQKDYANKKVEAAQATEAALKLQQSVDELKVLAQKKDDEIGRLQAEAMGAKMNLQKMHSSLKEKYDEIQRLKGQHPESIQKHNKHISESHTKFRSDDPAVSSKSKNNVGNDGQDETSQKRRRVSSISNDEDGNEQSGNDGDDGEQRGSDEEIANNQVQKLLRSPKRKRDACSTKVANGKSDESNRAVKRWYPHPPRTRKLSGNRGDYVRPVNDSLVEQTDKHKEFVRFLERWRIDYAARTMERVLEGQPNLIRRFNRCLPTNCQIMVEDEAAKQQPEEGPCQHGVPQPRGQHTSATPSLSAAAGLVKLKEAKQQPKREQQLPGRRGRVRRRCPAVRQQSCVHAEIGGGVEIGEEEEVNSTPRGSIRISAGVARPCEQQLPSASASAVAGLIKLNEVKQQP